MTIYTDAAGNKYLGDCRWGNHDINYPTTEWLNAVDNYSQSEMLSDLSTIFTQVGFNDVLVASTWPGLNQQLFSVGMEGFATPTFQVNAGSAVNSIASSTLFVRDPSLQTAGGVDYSLCCNETSICLNAFVYNATRTASSGINTFMGRLESVNPNFDYYTDRINHLILINRRANNTYTLGIINNGAMHFIQGAQKTLLNTGRAAYTVSCSDGQTPGSQWATDMWVYDNNADLGYPVIGRVPNMLLGIGVYVYLKPVKIEGSVFPDNGSPWYLPVGQFAGKTLLMRCYSSMT